MHTFLTELRQARRSLWQRKSYFLTCAATLALVLGANAAIFAVVNASLLRPMPFSTQGPVIHLFSQPPGTTSALQRNPLQQMEISRLRERARTLARLEGFYNLERVVTLAGEPTVAQASAVTAGLLPMMGTPAALGRLFLPAETAEPGHFVTVLTDRYWRQTLGAAANVLGSTLVIDAQPHTIIGVLPPSFAVPFLDADLFTPLAASPEPKPRAPPLTVVGLAELAPGVSLEQARQELNTISRQFAQEFPRTHTHWTLGAQTAREWQYGPIRAPLLMLLAATCLVLLIACVNIANLTSAHISSRTGELALRLALGASATGVWRIYAAELAIVTVAGLFPGLLLAHAAIPALLATNPAFARTLGPVTLDWRVQGFVLLAAVVTAVLASAIPTLRAIRSDSPAESLMISSLRTTGSRRMARMQRALVSIEVALCVALLMAGAVILQGFRELSRRSPGYDYNGVLTAQIRLPEVSYRTPELRTAAIQQMLDGLRGLPGVQSAGITQNAFIPRFSYQTLVKIKDRPRPDDQPHTVQYRRVSPDYFQAMRIRVLAGRAFSEHDAADRLPVAVISRRFAETLMPGMDPVGQVLLRNNPPPVTVIGVVDDASDVTVAEHAEPTLYIPWAQNNAFGVPVAFVIRTSVDPTSLVPAVRALLKGVDETLPLRKPQPLDVFVRESTAPERFRGFVLGILAVLGLLLSAIGIAGAAYRNVVDRHRDFAVRLALGAQPGEVIRMVVFESVRGLLLGAAAGIVAGAVLCGILAHFLQNVAPLDVFTGLLVTLTMLSAGALAALVPALRITGVNPAITLRG